MRRKGLILLLSLIFLLVGAAAGQSSSAGKSILLPEGTKFEKTSDGCLKFTLPNGCAVKVRGFARNRSQVGVIGDCGIVSDCAVLDGAGKLVASGKEGRLLSGPKPASGKGESLKVEGVTVWLPAVIEFEQVRVFSRNTFQKLAPQVAEVK
jgi:hypothetical protein